jgi:2-amino-4-hydroxy-6-hydroxymethyldihydropteridine diphosphokinase
LKTAFLSVGSNLGDRQANLRHAVELLEAAGVRIVKRSSFYQTVAQDLRNQAWFLNLVLQVETNLFPLQLLHSLQRIESQLGRRRSKLKGPRVIDLDILLFGKFLVKTAALEVPHPRMHMRRFVLEPLVEIAPELRHPALHKTARELLATVSDQQVRRSEIAW